MRKKFNVRTEPHVAEIGDDIELKFLPELDTEEILAPYRDLVNAIGGADLTDATKLAPEALEGIIKGIKRVLIALMLPESVEVFNANKIPDRTLGEIFMWLIDQYNEDKDRPTTPSSGSSPSEPSSGAGSTES